LSLALWAHRSAPLRVRSEGWIEAGFVYTTAA